MDKKFKVSEIQSGNETEKTSATRQVTRIGLSDLPDAIPEQKNAEVLESDEAPIPLETFVSKAPLPKRKEGPLPVIEKPKKEVIPNVFFDRSFLHLYFYKLFSFIFVMAVIELTIHGLKYLDGVDVFTPENFTSFFFGSYTEWNLIKVLLIFFVNYFMTPFEKVAVNKKGIYCQEVSIMYYFFTSQRTFLYWSDITRVEYHLRFFEPYLFFYDQEGKVLGQMDFSLVKPQDFFYFVEQNVGPTHPVMDAKKGPS